MQSESLIAYVAGHEWNVAIAIASIVGIAAHLAGLRSPHDTGARILKLMSVLALTYSVVAQVLHVAGFTNALQTNTMFLVKMTMLTAVLIANGIKSWMDERHGNGR